MNELESKNKLCDENPKGPDKEKVESYNNQLVDYITISFGDRCHKCTSEEKASFAVDTGTHDVNAHNDII